MDRREAVADPMVDPSEPSPVLEWLGLYVPSWGTSVLLHAALIALGAFVTWQSYASPPALDWEASFVPERRPNVEKRKDPAPKPSESDESRGRLVPRPSGLVHHLTNPFPDVADNRQDPLEIIGIGVGGRELGGQEGLGKKAGPGRIGFFTIPGQATRTVYLVDHSGSMTDSLDLVKFELKRSIMELDEGQEFHVIFFSQGVPVELPTRRLIAATDRNKRMALEFIDGVRAEGPTDPTEAIERTFAVRPELVYLLTDGEFDRAVAGQIDRLNAGSSVKVNTIAFLYDTGAPVLKEIARASGGSYKFVRESDLEHLGR